MKQICRSIIYN